MKLTKGINWDKKFKEGGGDYNPTCNFRCSARVRRSEAVAGLGAGVLLLFFFAFRGRLTWIRRVGEGRGEEAALALGS